MEFTKPPGSYEFRGFSFRKNQEGASKFGSILGRGRASVNNCSAAVWRPPNRTGRTLNSSWIFVSQLSRNYPHRRGIVWKEEKIPSLVGERQCGRHFRRQFWARVIASQNCLETMGDNFCRETSMIKMSRRALWEGDGAQSGPICGFLRRSAVFCESLRFSAVSCALQINAWISRRRGESAKSCGFLRKSAFSALSLCHPSSVPLSVPRPVLPSLFFWEGQGLQSDSSGRERPKMVNSQKWLGEGAKRSFEPRERKWRCTNAKWGCTSAKRVSDGTKDSWVTFAPWARTTFCTLSSPLLGIYHFRALSQNFRIARQGAFSTEQRKLTLSSWICEDFSSS